MSRPRTPNPLAKLYGRIGGLRVRATHDPREYTAAARRAFLEGFERQVDPEGCQTPEERRARAAAARKAHFAVLAYRSAVARAKRRRRKDARERPAPGGVGDGR